MMGGNGATEFAQGVYGGIGQQHPVSSTDNTISMNSLGNGSNSEISNTLGGSSVAANAAPITQSGGKKQQQEQQQQQGGDPEVVPGGQDGGKTIVGDLLVPAGFLYASQRYLRKTNKKKGGKKNGRKSMRNKRSRRKH